MNYWCTDGIDRKIYIDVSLWLLIEWLFPCFHHFLISYFLFPNFPFVVLSLPIDSIAPETALETSHVSAFLQYFKIVHSALKSLAPLSDNCFDLWLPLYGRPFVSKLVMNALCKKWVTSRDKLLASRDNCDTSRDNRDTSRDYSDTSRDNCDTSRDGWVTSRDNDAAYVTPCVCAQLYTGGSLSSPTPMVTS